MPRYRAGVGHVGPADISELLDYVVSQNFKWEAFIVPIYISRGCYTADAVRGMMAKPEDREPSIASVFEKLGGKLLCYYVTLGEFDWLLIAEFPNERVASSAILVAMASGSVSNVQTTVAMTSKQAMEAFGGAAAVAQSFKSPGK